LFAWWTDVDRERAIELRDGIRAAQREQLELQKKERDIRFRLSKAAALEAEVEARRVRAALGELEAEAIIIPPVESSSRIDRLALERIEIHLAEARDNEKEFIEKLRAHRLASNRRAAIAVYREKYEPAALQLKEARILLLGAQMDAAGSGAAAVVHDVTFNQCVLPCEPGLSGVERKYVPGNMAEWFILGPSDDMAQVTAVSTKSRADFLSLVGADVPIRWGK